jgi:hypothetical protein
MMVKELLIELADSQPLQRAVPVPRTEDVGEAEHAGGQHELGVG